MVYVFLLAKGFAFGSAISVGAMKFASILGPLNDLRFAFLSAIGPTLRALFRNPVIIFHPKQLSRLFFNHVWTLFGDHIDESGRDSKVGLIKNVHGVVLDIGAGILLLLIFEKPIS